MILLPSSTLVVTFGSTSTMKCEYDPQDKIIEPFYNIYTLPVYHINIAFVDNGKIPSLQKSMSNFSVFLQNFQKNQLYNQFKLNHACYCDYDLTSVPYDK